MVLIRLGKQPGQRLAYRLFQIAGLCAMGAIASIAAVPVLTLFWVLTR